MDEIISLSREEEFWMITGVVLRNWTALQIGINECNLSVPIMKEKITDILNFLCDATYAVRANKYTVEDMADTLASHLDNNFDVILDDDSDITVVHHLLELSDLVEQNNRTAILQTMSQFQDHRHILSGEKYQPQRVIRKGEQNVSTNTNGVITVPVLNEPVLKPTEEAVPFGALESISGSSTQYSVFQPSQSSGGMRETKLDHPERVFPGNANAQSTDGESDNDMDTDSTGPHSNPDDGWKVVGKKKK